MTVNARVYLGGGQTIVISGNNRVFLDTVSYDPSGIWNGGTLLFTPSVAGLYLINYAVALTYWNNPQNWYANVEKNGVVVSQGFQATLRGGTGGDFCGSSGCDLIRFNGTTDSCGLWIECAEAASTNVPLQSGSGLTFLAMCWMAP